LYKIINILRRLTVGLLPLSYDFAKSISQIKIDLSKYISHNPLRVITQYKAKATVVTVEIDR